MPMDLIARTPLQREHDIRYLASLPLNELRKRQDIVNEQYQITIRKEHTKNVLKSLDNLDEMLRDLLEAIDRREFSEDFPKPRKTKRARGGCAQIPQDLSKRTPIEREGHIHYLVSLPLSELRKRQKICEAERSILYTRYLKDKFNGVEDRFGNGILAKTISNIDEKERDLIEAINMKEFGTKPRKTKRARGGCA